jgi:hypothetical protein
MDPNKYLDRKIIIKFNSKLRMDQDYKIQLKINTTSHCINHMKNP